MAKKQQQPSTPAAEQPAAPAPAATASGPAPLRIRNLGLIKLRVGDILDNENNHRTHPVPQRLAFRGTVEQVGWYGYPDVFVVPEGPDAGKHKLIDGELRKYDLLEVYGPDQIIECNLTDFTPAEADLALLTHDPVSALAGTNRENLKTLTDRISAASGGDLNKHLAGLIDKLKADNKIPELATQVAPSPDEFKEVNESTMPAPDHECPQCGYKSFIGGAKKKVGTRRVDARDGDKKQARDRVAHLVTVGVLPAAASVPCVDCGDLGGVLDHQYDHHLGYAAEHHESVQVVCSQCHKHREDARLVPNAQ